MQAHQKLQSLSRWESEQLHYPLLQGYWNLLPKIKQKASFALPTPIAEFFFYSADGRYLAVRGDADRLFVYDHQGKFLHTIGTSGPAGLMMMDASEYANIIWGENPFGNMRVMDFEGTQDCEMPVSTVPLKTGRNVYFVHRPDSDKKAPIQVYDTKCQSVRTIPQLAEEVYDFSLSPDAKNYAIQYRGDSSRITRVQINSSVIEVDRSIWNTRLAPTFDPQGTRVVFCSNDALDIYSVQTLTAEKEHGLPAALSRAQILECRFIDENRILLSGLDFVYIYDLRTPAFRAGRFIEKLPQVKKVDPKGDWLYSIQPMDRKRGKLSIVPINGQSEKSRSQLIPFHSEFRLAFNPSHPFTFAFAPATGEVSLWDLDAKAMREIAAENSQEGVIFSADGEYYLTGDAREVKLWAHDHTFIRSFAPASPPGSNARTSFAFDPQHAFVLVARSSKVLDLYEIDGKLIKTFEYDGSLGEPLRSQYTPDGRKLLLSDWSNHIHLLDLENLTLTRQTVAEANGTFESFSFASDSTYLVDRRQLAADTISSCSIDRLNMAGEILVTYPGYCLPEGRIWDAARENFIAFQPDGTIALVNATSAGAKRLGKAASRVIRSAQFSPDFQRIFVTGVGTDIIDRFHVHGEHGAIRTAAGGFTSLIWNSKDTFWVRSLNNHTELRQSNGSLLLDFPEGIRHLVVNPKQESVLVKLDDQPEFMVWDMRLEPLMAIACDWSMNHLEGHTANFPDLAAFCRASR